MLGHRMKLSQTREKGCSVVVRLIHFYKRLDV